MNELPSIFFNVLTPVFTVILVGYFAGPRLKLDVPSLTRLAYTVLVPAFVFDVISKADFPAGLAAIDLRFPKSSGCAALSGWTGSGGAGGRSWGRLIFWWRSNACVA